LVDGRGKYLIPGMWDMHAHNVPRTTVLYLANGVTGVRSTADDLDSIRKMRDRIAAGELSGPRIYFCGPHVDGPKGHARDALVVATPEEARAAVDDLRRRGVDFIKVYDELSRDAYFAIAEETKRLHISFAGHVPRRITAAEASDAGQKSIEHLSHVLLGCSREEAALMEQGLTNPRRVQTRQGLVLWPPPVPVDTYDPEKAKVLFEKFARNGTWQTPTFTVLHLHAFWSDAETKGHARLEYVPAAVRRAWENSAFAQLVSSTPPADAAEGRKAFDLDLKIVGQMFHAGVGILPGCDTDIPYIVQGFSLHDELEWLVKAGLTPMEALQAATIRPAEYFGITGWLGAIAEGKVADLVLLNGDPVQDVVNTRKIESVMAGGHYLSRADLDRMLEKLKKEAGPLEPK
jgi:imidazolonepropionase-like amidohydrolase